MRIFLILYDLLLAAVGLLAAAAGTQILEATYHLGIPLKPWSRYLPRWTATNPGVLFGALGVLLAGRWILRRSSTISDADADNGPKQSSLDYNAMDRDDSSSFDAIRRVIASGGQDPRVEVIDLVDEIITSAAFMLASDIHLEPKSKQVRLSYRIDGILKEVATFPKALEPKIINRIKIMSRMDISRTDAPQDGRIEEKVRARTLNARVSVFPTLSGEKVVIRILESGKRILGLDEFGIQDEVLQEFKKLLHAPQGILVFTGPTGSGKTSLMYASLREILEGEEAKRNIVTLEDPIEQKLDDITQSQVDNKKGLTFATGLRAILRQDPDIIMVGEIRDLETGKIALQAGQTGHMLLSTVHANSSSAAFGRLVDMGLEPFLLASAVSGVIAQRLVRKLCQACRRPSRPIPALLEQIGLPEDAGVAFFESPGCRDCNGTGFNGRIAIFELLRNSDAVSDAVMRKASAGEIMNIAKAAGMLTLLDDGLIKVNEGRTSLVELLRVVQ